MSLNQNNKQSSECSFIGCELSEIELTKGERNNGFILSVKRLSLSVGKHQSRKIPIMGKTGSGKSTLLNIMSAMEWPNKGEVTWCFPDGRKINWDKSGMDPQDAKDFRNRYTGYAFQDSTLISHLTVMENLCYPLQIRKKSPTEIKTMARTALERVLIDKETVEGLACKYPSHLSGGQRQRVALVQAMIHDPYVLFADEPTGNLDPETREQVMKVLFDWISVANGERSLFWVTHHSDDPKLARALECLVVNDGRCKLTPCDYLPPNQNPTRKLAGQGDECLV